LGQRAALMNFDFFLQIKARNRSHNVANDRAPLKFAPFIAMFQLATGKRAKRRVDH
jgi:hypothetical protein